MRKRELPENWEWWRKVFSREDGSK